MGNPWVFFGVSLPISVHTRTHALWVRVQTDMITDMDRGTIPKGKGMDIIVFIYTCSNFDNFLDDIYVFIE